MSYHVQEGMDFSSFRRKMVFPDVCRKENLGVHPKESWLNIGENLRICQVGNRQDGHRISIPHHHVQALVSLIPLCGVVEKHLPSIPSH
jgi:hypothetical protein